MSEPKQPKRRKRSDTVPCPPPTVDTSVPNHETTPTDQPGKREDYATYWVTRDSTAGKLSDHFEVWTQRPRRVVVDRDDGSRDVRWGGDGHFKTWNRATAVIELRAAVPDSDLQSVRVGDEPTDVVVS